MCKENEKEICNKDLQKISGGIKEPIDSFDEKMRLKKAMYDEKYKDVSDIIKETIVDVMFSYGIAAAKEFGYSVAPEGTPIRRMVREVFGDN